LILIPFSGCQNKTSIAKERLREELVSFRKTEIVIPHDMTVVRHGKLVPFIRQTGLPILVVYIDGQDCTDCRIAHLVEYEPLFQLSDSTGTFQLMVVFSPSEGHEMVLQKLIDANYRFPVYFDSYSEFSDKNDIPLDSRFHTFLLNAESFPILVGNPLTNPEINKLFHQLLNI